MRDHKAIEEVIKIIRASTPGSVDVSIRAGDGSPELPAAIIDWSTFRMAGEHGHRPFAGKVYDDSGNLMGKEFHGYFNMEVDVTLRFYDPVARDKAYHDLQMDFLPYEGNSDAFHADATEFTIDGGTVSANTIVERDWHEAVLSVSFKYVKKTQDVTGYDVIEAIDVDVEANDSIDDGYN